MNKYSLKEATEIIRTKIHYNISDASMGIYKRLGVIKPFAVELVPYMNKMIPVYSDESIDQFVAWYLDGVAKGKIKQFEKGKIA